MWGAEHLNSPDPPSPPGQEELESYPLGSVQGCLAALDTSSRYDSVLAISLQERSPPGTTVLLFQCEQLGVRSSEDGQWGGGGVQPPGLGVLMVVGLCQAETLKGSLEKLVKQRKEEQRSQYGHR